jgi:Patatin-like phospholipase
LGCELINNYAFFRIDCNACILILWVAAGHLFYSVVNRSYYMPKDIGGVNTRADKPSPTLDDDALTRQEILAEEAAEVLGIEPSADPDELLCQMNQANTAALCLSGGGIRSAAFALGVLQGLARHPKKDAPEASLLSEFHYLSTVSGGGYIGSWFSSAIARLGFKAVLRSLHKLEPDDPYKRDSAVVRWLRSYSNFLTPS